MTNPDDSPPHAAEIDAVLRRFGTDAATGLTSDQGAARRSEAGFNEIAAAPGAPWWKLFLDQFRNVVIWVLIGAAVISGFTDDWTDAIAILAIVALNAGLGFFQEERAEKALAALKQLIVPVAKTIRDGKLQSLPARELVPGDLVELEAGDSVPADVRLVRAASLSIQEAVLTGESMPVEKKANVVLPPETSLADRRNMAYLSTTVAAGTATAVVVATGMQTEIGQIAGALEAQERKPTPLQRQLESVGRMLIVMCFCIVAVVFALNYWRALRQPVPSEKSPLLEALLVSVSLAVAAVPEGLPAVVTMALALGLQRMARRNALIRKLPSVETLGCVTVICSDKTGTLTRNEMTVREVVAGGQHYDVTGAGYDPHGEFVNRGSQDGVAPISDDLRTALRIGAVCNHSRLENAGAAAGWRIVGDPMEGALIVAAVKADPDFDSAAVHRLAELPFDSERKMMSVAVAGPHGRRQYTKGAQEVLLDRCQFELMDGDAVALTPERRDKLLGAANEMAQRALRILACAYRDLAEGEELVEEGLTLAGLVGIIDPPREEVRAAIQHCRDAGIRTVMITGDHPTTAVAIARELELIPDDQPALTGQQIDQLSDDDFQQRVEQTAIYARVAPSHKLRVIKGLQKWKHVVAMTGDGVNDAPAIKAADIGIAMGRTGTDVTREAADMVLLDDNFTSIVNAVEEGRAIYANIQKFLAYLLTCNVGELLLMLAAGLLGWPAPLMPIQLLWINLVTDGLPALALAMEPAEPDLMRRPPRRAEESMISWNLGAAVLLQGVMLMAVGLIAYWIGSRSAEALGAGYSREHARTLAFNTVVLEELFRVLALRSPKWTFWQLGIRSNPYLFAASAASILLQLALITLPFTRPIFEVTTQTWQEWLMVGGLALVPVTLLECFKLWRQHKRP
jgi:Ca2+-transporting ATPase